jgi:transcriptional regulator with XRE-family HTH domain
MKKVKLPKLLKDLRESSKLTLDGAAQRIGISVSYLHELESGVAEKPKVAVLDRIVAVYCCDKDLLFASAGKVSSDVYYKLVDYPQLMQIIRNYQVGV